MEKPSLEQIQKMEAFKLEFEALLKKHSIQSMEVVCSSASAYESYGPPEKIVFTIPGVYVNEEYIPYCEIEYSWYHTVE